MIQKRITFICILTMCFTVSFAEIFYVDAKNGQSTGNGHLDTPFKTIEEAVSAANKLTGQGSITIKILPGLYTLNDKVSINPLRPLTDTSTFIVEAYIMPSDTAWRPNKMPIIQSVSSNNSDAQFPHSSGFYIASDNVHIRGLKFLGNANPDILYYYPINRMNANLKNLSVSNCYFIGDKNGAFIQGGIWSIGHDVSVSNCVFKECRNAILIFRNEGKTRITNNVITDSYESAFWMLADNKQFSFTNNVISRCKYVWVECSDDYRQFTLKNSVITDCAFNTGKWSNDIGCVVEYSEKLFNEHKVIRQGSVSQIERTEKDIPIKHLHIEPVSIGFDLNAGIF